MAVEYHVDHGEDHVLVDNDGLKYLNTFYALTGATDIKAVMDHGLYGTIGILTLKVYVDSCPCNTVMKPKKNWVYVAPNSITCIHNGALPFGGTCYAKHVDRAHVECVP